MNTSRFVLLLLSVAVSAEGAIVRTVDVGVALQKGDVSGPCVRPFPQAKPATRQPPQA